MSEFLRLWCDLEVMANVLQITQLNHYYKKATPSNSKALQETMLHFQMRELEASDYRSAYHQFTDWLYGWSVSDGKEYNLNEVPGRPAREINMALDREKQDASRLMATFQTLTSVTLRHLKVGYAEIDRQFPHIGKGLETLGAAAQADDSLFEDLTAKTANNIEKVWGDIMMADDDRESKLGPIHLEGSTHDEMTEYVNIKGTKVLKSDKFESGSEMNLVNEVTQNTRLSKAGSAHGSFSFLSSDKKAASLQQTEFQASEVPKIIEQGSDTHQDNQESDLQNKRKEELVKDAKMEIEDPRKAIQRDVNQVFQSVNRCTEYTLVALSSIAAISSFAELLGDMTTFAKASLMAHQLSQDFISNTLKTVWDLLNIELPIEATLAALRNPDELKNLLQMLVALRSENGATSKFGIRKFYHKFAVVHEFLLLWDIHVFPNFANAHSEGGNDCIIRITDIRAQNRQICLAQYVGHKSIISDVKFTHKDSHIVSSSYDRTIKIWNSHTAMVEKTLLGHIDAVTSCDISPDGRYIVSGSLDNTFKLWDFNTGENIATVKKHSRWVKKVKFSHDGRYIATAGLDRRVYLWDTKIVANSRSPTHNRCIDNFNDFVLDMLLFKPSNLITTSRDSTLRLFDYMTGHEVRSFNIAPSWACTLALSANEEYFATGSFDNNINIFRTNDFVRLREIRVFNLGIMCVRFPSDLSYLAVGTAEGFLQQIEL